MTCLIPQPIKLGNGTEGHTKFANHVEKQANKRLMWRFKTLTSFVSSTVPKGHIRTGAPSLISKSAVERFCSRNSKLAAAMIAMGTVAHLLGFSAPAQAQTKAETALAASSTPAQWDERAVQIFLSAQLLAQDQDFEQAALMLWPLARHLKQVELYERMAQWSLLAKRFDLLYSVATAWSSQQANAPQPKYILSYLSVPLHLDRVEKLRWEGKPEEARQTLLSAYAARSKLVTADMAILLAEYLEDDFHDSKAIEVFRMAESLSQYPTEQSMIAARILSIKAKGADEASLSALLKMQQMAKSEALTDKVPTAALSATADAASHLAIDKSPSRSQQGTATKKTELYKTLTQLSIGTLRELGQYEQALMLIDQLPADQAEFEAALCYEMMGRTQQAHDLLRGALKTSPKAPHLLNALGYSLVDQPSKAGDLKQGFDLLLQAYNEAPKSPAIMDSLGWAYFKMQDFAKALPLLQRAFDVKRDPEIAAHLGELLFTMGQQDKATAVWRQGLSVAPKHKVLRQTLTRLGVKL